MMSAKRDRDTGRKDSLGRPIYESSTKKEAQRASTGVSGTNAANDFSTSSLVDDVEYESVDLDPNDVFFEEDMSEAVDDAITYGRGAEKMLSRIFDGDVPPDFYEVIGHEDNWREQEKYHHIMMETPGMFENVFYSEDDGALVYVSRDMDSAAEYVKKDITELYGKAKGNIEY